VDIDESELEDCRARPSEWRDRPKY